MASRTFQRTVSQALIACLFVVLVSAGFSQTASASCGDYLLHKATKISKTLTMDDSQGVPGNLPAPTGCRSGKCGQTPPALPLESSRLARLDANHLRAQLYFVLATSDKFELLDDASPLQPTLDLSDPPPRAL